MKKIIFLLILFTCCFSVLAQAPFVISNIRVEGLEKLDEGTVFNHLPLKVGDAVNEEETKISIKALFETGFFKDVSLAQEGTTLVVKVVERPSIASIKISGNSQLKTEIITQALEQAEVVEGRIFKNAVLGKIEQEIKNAYLGMGRYSATVETSVDDRVRNRVAINIDIDEGRVARIKKINIIGAEKIDLKEIKKQMQLRDKRGWALFSRKDQYSKQKFEADLETIQSFYHNQGYHAFNVVSSNVEIGQNKQSIFISITIEEGEIFTFGETSIEGVEADVAEDLMGLVTIESGMIFSRAQVSAVRSALNEHFADQGYAFAEVRPNIETDESTQAINIVFSVILNQRVNVRRIDISGNLYTRDEVIRRDLRQFEGAWYSASAVRLSKDRLQRLGLFESVQIETPAVPGTTDQVDMKVIVVERDSGSILFSTGYSDANGVLFGAEFEQRNLFGTGKDLSVSVDRSDSTRSASVSYTNPYYTPDGISRGFRFESTEVDAEKVNTARYLLNKQALGVVYKIPVAEHNTLNVGLTYEKIELEAQNGPFTEIISEQPDGDDFVLTLGISKDTRNNFFFPDSGGAASATVEYALPGSDYEYYKLNLLGSFYIPLPRQFTFKAGLGFGIGDGYGGSPKLPFFKNYFVGGANSIRGFESRSLGPRDCSLMADSLRSCTTGEPIGGDTRILGNIELQFPAFGGGGSVDKRSGLFIDGGMVYGDNESVDLSAVRYSAGLFFNWYSPIGPFTISYALPIDGGDDTDELEKLQLSLGTVFK